MIEVPHLTEEQRQKQKSRNLAVFLALVGFVVLVFGITIVKIRMGYG